MSFIKNFAKTSAATGLAASLASYATNTETLWNKTQQKPSWQPPEIAFPIAWSALYSAIAAASAYVLTELDKQRIAAGDDSEKIAAIDQERRRFKRALAANLVLNATWSVLYWNVRNQWLAAGEVALLAASSSYLTHRAWKVSHLAGVGLAPYAAWTLFATALNTEIARLNS